jgi:peptidoglycan/xylan/chitin deacetylase (PgdA/CDA1 family)
MNKSLLLGALGAAISSYYLLKPLIPRRVRYLFRRQHATNALRRSTSVWPIREGTERQPANWSGWPMGKQFAFVLTHDVEGPEGVDRCEPLMDLEERNGFRSSFNFVPEGSYPVAAKLRAEMTHRGFEVGIHDLHHDGSLFRNFESFQAQAQRINRYLAQWNVSGFRAGFMFHNLDWLKALEVRYDASTFDVDPFEPQPDGVGTIFPFWVDHDENRPQNGGFMELPYTLVQDSTLFLLLRERTIDVWKRKLDWVAEHGGMALVIVHPDYLRFDLSQPTWKHYPASLYSELLEYVRTRYAGRYWQALPRQVAEYCATFRPRRPGPMRKGLSLCLVALLSFASFAVADA